MLVAVKGVAKKYVVILAISTVARMQISVPDSALHPLELRLPIPDRITAAAYGLLSSKPPYESQERWRYAKEPTKVSIGQVIQHGVQKRIRHP